VPPPPISRRGFIKRAVVAGARAGAAAAAVGTVGAGCGKRGAVRDGAVTLNFYNYSNPEWRYYYTQNLIPAFERKHPGIKVRFNEAFGDRMYDGKLLTLIAGGVAPDVFHVVQSNFPSYAAKENVLPLDEFISNDPSFSLDDFFPKMADAMRYKGKLVGLPSDFSTIVMFYNRDLFDRHQIAYPRQDWTWDEYLDIALRLTHDTDGDGRLDAWGTANQPVYNRWPAWVWMWGGDVFSPDGSRCTMDDKKSIAGFEFFVDLALKEHVAPRPNMLELELFDDRFASSRTAMIPNSRYMYKRFLKTRKLDFNWDVAPMPRGPAAQATTFIWGGNCIFRGTKHPKESWEFLKFISGKEGAEVTVAAGNALPPYRPAAEAEIANPRDKSVPKNDRAFLDAISYGRVAPFPRQYPEFVSAMVPLHESFIGISTPEEACVQFARKVNSFLHSDVF
jgi:multiple sugar transport system substrate-binding protein